MAVDCSDTARGAVELAWRVAGAGVQALDAVYAYDLFSAQAIRRVGVEGEELEHYRLDVRRKAEAAAEAFVSTCDVGIPVRVVLHEGDPRSVILDAVAQRGCDLVAVGTHGRSGLSHVLLGSVAEAVIRAAPCDVLVARALGFHSRCRRDARAPGRRSRTQGGGDGAAEGYDGRQMSRLRSRVTL